MPGMDGIQLAQRIRAEARWSAVRLILQSTRDDHDDGSERSQLFAAILTKPLRRSQIFSCLSRVMSMPPGVSMDASVGESAPPVPSPGGRAVGPRILLVEDNPVNREVAVGMLESLGCTIDAAENGWLAIEAMNTQAYDAVLMDCRKCR